MVDHVFISYSRQQLHFAESLSVRLQKEGVPTWFDLQRLEPGCDWGQEIATALENCAALVLVASRAALLSEYVQAEWRSALQGGKPIYIALFDAAELPDELCQASMVDFRGVFRRAVRSLARAIQTQSVVRDPVPRPNRFDLPTKMPPGVYATSLALLVEAILAPYLALVLPIEPPPLVRLTGLAVSGLALWEWWRLTHHRVRLRWIACLLSVPFVLAMLALVPREVGWVYFLIALVFSKWGIAIVLIGLVLYLARRLWEGDLLRWSLPSKTAVREPRSRTDLLGRRQHAERLYDGVLGYTLHYAPADRPIAGSIRRAMREAEIMEAQSDGRCQIIVLTERTPRQQLRSLLASDRPVIAVLAANLQIEGDPLLEDAVRRQLIDYRDRSVKKLAGLAEYARNPAASMRQPEGQRTVPLPFTEAVVPPQIRAHDNVVSIAAAYLLVASITAIVLTLVGTRPLSALDLAGLCFGPLLLWLVDRSWDRRVPQIVFAPFYAASVAVNLLALLGRARIQASVALQPAWRNLLVGEFPRALSNIPMPSFGGFIVLLGAASLLWPRLGDWLPALTFRTRGEQTLQRRVDGPRWRRRLWPLLVGPALFFLYPTVLDFGLQLYGRLGLPQVTFPW